MKKIFSVIEMIRRMDTEMGIITWDRVSENNSSLLREIGLNDANPIYVGRRDREMMNPA